MAMARYVFPVPAGPMPKVISGLHAEQIGLLSIGFWNNGRLARRGLNAQIQKTAQSVPPPFLPAACTA